MKLYYVIISLIILSNLVFGQNNSSTEINNIPQNFINVEKAGHVSSLITRKNGERQIYDVDLTEKIKVIVEFTDEPLFIAQRGNNLQKINTVAYSSQFSKFANDINLLNSQFARNFKLNISPLQIERKFYKVFNGVSLTIPRGIINSINSLEYVKKIHVNMEVKALLNESVSLIKADVVWNEFNAQGDSIIVGILDTGIDYFHPALGGGFGKGYKVIGGYDIINDDNDPMDDHGHGTHVAGIVSANSDSIKGVAPKSLLMGFKVLDADGYGLESQIIAGIERALDPDDDGNYEDKVDVVNISLGGIGNPDDALSTAVNNAVELGVVFCIAAGNSGQDNDIGSPGTAEKAITVGSTDKSDMISSFSSKGPNKKSYTIKPDILAPGSDILSTMPGSIYEKLSGTSMASPHVAGVCALLKQIHKDWTPEMIKSAIMVTAKDLYPDKMKEGSGRIDALKAAEVTTLAIPASLGFGLDNDSLDLWIKYDTVMVTNLSFSSQTYTVNMDGIIFGISIENNVNNFSLSYGETQQLIFTLKVDNSIVPYTADSTFAYNGNIYITGETDSLHIPWAFVKKPLLVLNYDKFPMSQDIFNSTHYGDYEMTFTEDFKRAEVLVSPGTYTMFFYFDDFLLNGKNVDFIVKENVVINGYKEITVNSSDAKNLIRFNGVDENSRPLDTSNNSVIDFTIRYEGEIGGYGFTILFPSNAQIRSSNFNDFVIYAKQVEAETENLHKIRIINYPKKTGLENSHTFVNSPDDFLKKEFSIHTNPDNDNKKVTIGRVAIDKYASYAGISSISPTLDVSNISNGELYSTIDFNDEIKKRIFFATDFSKDSISILPVIPQNGSWFMSGYFEVNEEHVTIQTLPYVFDPVLFKFSRSDKNPLHCYKGLNFGDGAIYLFLNSHNSPSKIEMYPGFCGQLNEFRVSDLYNSTYEVYDNSNNLIAADTLYKLEPLTVSPNKYKMIIKNNHYTVDGKWGHSTTTSEFDLSQDNQNPPTIRSLQILNSEGIPSSKLSINENCKLFFSVDRFDQNSFVFLKREKDSVWSQVEIKDTSIMNGYGKYFTADLSEFTKFDSSAIDLKINIVMTNNNKTELILSPAFIVNYWDGTTGIEEYEANSPLNQSYSLAQNYPNPFNPNTIIKYCIPANINGERSKVTLTIYDVLGSKVVTLVEKVQSSGNYEVNWNAANYASGVYFYRLQAGKFIETKKMLLLK